MNRKALHIAACASLLVGAGAVATNGFGAFAVAAAGDLTACAKKKGKNRGALRLASRCKKSERKVTLANASGGTPAGAVMHFDRKTCPAGWSEYTSGRGRYLVGLPEGGTPGAGVGTPLTGGEDRATGQHAHGVTDPGHAHSVAYDNDMVANLGNTIGGTRRVDVEEGAATTSTVPTGITVQPAGAVAGTNAPYVQLLACRKE